MLTVMVTEIEPQRGYLNMYQRWGKQQTKENTRKIRLVCLISSSLLMEETTPTLVRRPRIWRQGALVAVLLLVSYVGRV